MIIMLHLARKNIAHSWCTACRIVSVTTCKFSQELENKYSVLQKEKILQIINDTDPDNLLSLKDVAAGTHWINDATNLALKSSKALVTDFKQIDGYNITKAKLKKLTEWVSKNGHLQTISDIETINGFSGNYAGKFCDRLLDGPQSKEPNLTKKIKGQVLHPPMTEAVRKNCNTVLAVYVTVNSVCWTLIDKADYEVVDWKYRPIDYPDGKSLKMTDILNIAWEIIHELPSADMYVMKAEATSLRATGSDPNNPKVLGVNLQKAQMIAMMVALINARSNGVSSLCNEQDEEVKENFKHKVYFLRPTLPYRLYGTLVGNERVSTDQTVEMILQEAGDKSESKTKAHFSEDMKSMFRAQKDLQKDMLGHCLLLALTFMDVCVYMNKESIEKLIKRGE